MEIVYKAGNIIEAHIVAGMLNACEIPTYVGGHFLQGAVGDLSPTGFANVFVASEHFDQAAALVAEYEKNDLCSGDLVTSPRFVHSF
ncbi:MAG: DUF2007 domain-containing protein [Limnobacter sp.]|uniref:DUF2007 domain-containing protein n=1 Tax=Limnobacter profundi TaxID=2732163 RepID=A0ABX6N2M5_9BURK|nr:MULTISPECIES: DUF2007 domain-containing protein [unclassified Limnobacter]MBA4314053.1 hypothetical protein [Alcaligenaceae bacterium]PZO25590.1 MAG: hypothetical protein DCE89_02550 [Betaproteobacteria bacterium]MDZ4050416.1 DUF2007 domain-containing protein [Limnobacter sp.]QJR28621.1 DUF2007 domain-containing protein [Limnobacter sp. SAORIC-580]RZO92123.1 MAG: DUF2007 domain-containing protein [Limnobacter sp.]